MVLEIRDLMLMFGGQTQRGFEHTLSTLKTLAARSKPRRQASAESAKRPVFPLALTDFRSVRMGRMHAQSDVLDYTAWLLAVAERNRPDAAVSPSADAAFEQQRERVRRYGVSPDSIATRQLCTFPERAMPDQHGLPDLPALFSAESEHFAPPGLAERMQRFGEVTLDCFERLYRNDTVAPDTLIHVSCSGYLSPSPAQRYLSRRGWCKTGVLHSYHMGCYGAFPPVEMALGLLSSSHFALGQPKQRIDIVHTEFLSLHADFTAKDPGSIVNMTLFADGFVRYAVTPARELAARGESGLEVLATSTRLIENSADDMTWTPRGDVFEMYLSKEVPAKLRDHIVPFIRELCAQAGIDFEREKSELICAVHPGGPKILDHFRDALGIEESQQRWSRKVLLENGNMSSATVPHIWREILEDASVPAGARIVSVAFGPGLTATGMVLRKV